MRWVWKIVWTSAGPHGFGMGGSADSDYGMCLSDLARL